MFIGGGGSTDINFSKSAYIFLDRDTSYNYVPLFQLSPGSYFIFAYDIESNGLINSGVINPAIAVANSFTGSTQGM